MLVIMMMITMMVMMVIMMVMIVMMMVMIVIMMVRAEDMFSSPWEVMQWTGLTNEESPSAAR